MQSRLLHEAGGQRTFSIVLQTGDEVFRCLDAFARRERLSAAQFTAIGAFRHAVLGYFDWERKEYLRNPIDEQVEVASLVGDVVSGQQGEPALHVHAVLGRRNGDAVAGHLLGAEVRPTLEIVLTESPAHLHKRYDPESGLALIAPTANS
jgi:uncharacterized protein